MPLSKHMADRINAGEFVRPMGVSAPVCEHEDTEPHCPMCGALVDDDTMVCRTCREAVAPVWSCVYCEEPVSEGFDRPVTPTPTGRTIPPHFHVWVDTNQRHTDTGDWVKRCTICPHEV